MARGSGARAVPLSYDDGFRSAIASLTPLVLLIAPLAVRMFGPGQVGPTVVVGAMCAALVLFSVTYLVWTHVLFSHTPPRELRRIAALQHGRGAGRLAHWLGFGDTVNWTMSAAGTTLVVAVAAAVLGRSGGVAWLLLLVLATAATAWATMVYAFGLLYFRLHAAGERFTFHIDEEPVFIDFISMAVMISSVGAMSAGTPRTRAGLNAVRTHTFLGFAFNTFVIAMVVSLVSGLVTGVA